MLGTLYPETFFTLIVFGPWSTYTWLTVLTGLFFTIWPFIAFIVWVVKDSKKFKLRGIQTSPFLWGVGTVFPLVLVVFPLYLIKRNIIWPQELRENNLESVLEAKKLSVKRRWIQVFFKTLFLFFIVYVIGLILLIELGKKNKEVGYFLVNHSLNNRCSYKKSGCDELRPFPKALQDKKIVFNKNTNIEFEPFSKNERGLTDLDVLGFIDTNSHDFVQDNMIDPNLGKRGNLLEREYKIVRAVYHYNCSYCFDSSDYAYVVLEDLKGNRFTSILDDTDSSTVPGRDIPWDEQVPFEIGVDGELGKLIDINHSD